MKCDYCNETISNIHESVTFIDGEVMLPGQVKKSQMIVKCNRCATVNENTAYREVTKKLYFSEKPIQNRKIIVEGYV
jgi:uncharacterized Zn finger protein